MAAFQRFEHDWKSHAKLINDYRKINLQNLEAGENYKNSDAQ